MSTVVVQVGQCGNQIGDEFWAAVDKDKANKEGLVYLNHDGYLRSVNIDSEPKVLRKLTHDSQHKIRAANIQRGRRGRGANWALGFYGTKNTEEDRLLESAVDATRREIERCSSFSGILMMQSSSGGTGSGLGSRLCEVFREEFPLSHMMNAVVMPHRSGDSPLQNYNSLLCLSKLQRYSDCVLWFHNDEILSRLEKRSSGKDAPSCVSLEAMNRHIARCVAGLVLPTDTLTPNSGVSVGSEPWELVRSVSPQPATKFVHVNHINKSKLSWENMTGLLAQGIQKYNPHGEPYHSISNLVVARGDTPSSFLAHSPKVHRKIIAAYRPVDWNPFPVEHWIDRDNLIGRKDSASLTVASNHDSVADRLRQISDGARTKYSAGAYLHWYNKYGCTESDFEESFETFHEVLEAYSEATR